MSKSLPKSAPADFHSDLQWSKEGHLYLAKTFYKEYAYKGQFVYCDRDDQAERGALLIQKKLHVDTIIQKGSPYNAICIDEKIVKGYYSAFTLETHSITRTPKMPDGLGRDGCIMQSNADELLYGFPIEKDCACIPLSKKWQKCTHSILAMELYLIDFQALQNWFINAYDCYPWRAIRNKGYFTHVRIVPINDVYRNIGADKIKQIVLSRNETLQDTTQYVDPLGQIYFLPHKNEVPFFKRKKK